MKKENYLRVVFVMILIHTRGEAETFYFGVPLFFRKLWLLLIYVRRWDIVYLINDFTTKMVWLFILAYTKAMSLHT